MTPNQKAIQAKIRALKAKATVTTLDKRYSIVGKIRQLQRDFYSMECNQSLLKLSVSLARASVLKLGSRVSPTYE